MVEGTVRLWHAELGWGVLDSPETPGGCWAHFSDVVIPGYRDLRAGEVVRFTYGPGQDGYDFAATKVWPARPDGAPESSATAADEADPGPGYSSTLTIAFDDGG